MSPQAAHAQLANATTPSAAERSEPWLRAARQARLLAWASLLWMTLAGGLGVLAGVEANSISVLTWAASSAVEGMASAVVIWRFTGPRNLSEHSERRAQRWVACSFFLLTPYFLYEAINRLVHRTRPEATVLAIALTASSVVLMPLLAWAKLSLGRRLDSGATSGEGTQNLLCAAQALAALIAVAAAGAGITVIDPLAALLIAGIAARKATSYGVARSAAATPSPVSPQHPATAARTTAAPNNESHGPA